MSARWECSPGCKACERQRPRGLSSGGFLLALSVLAGFIGLWGLLLVSVVGGGQ